MHPSRRRACAEKPPYTKSSRAYTSRRVNLDRRGVGREVAAVGLKHDFAARRQHFRERLKQRDRIGHAVQDSEAQGNVEPLAKLADVQRIHAVVFDARSD
jgi:hypothetical protein